MSLTIQGKTGLPFEFAAGSSPESSGSILSMKGLPRQREFGNTAISHLGIPISNGRVISAPGLEIRLLLHGYGLGRTQECSHGQFARCRCE